LSDVKFRALIGRDRELEAFDAALRAVAAGERAVLMLSGEPGIGKTRLLEELAARLHALGATVAWGRTSEVGLTPAFWPFIQVLSALATPDDPAPPLDSCEERADAAARLARFGEVARFLERRALCGPIGILLDDLHAADPSSLQLLEHVLPVLVARRVLFALSARDRDASPEIAAALGRIQRGAQRLALARLSRDEVSQLVSGAESSTHAAQVFELSEGNPLFVEELLAALDAEGTLRLPALSSVRAVIRERVARLPYQTRAVLSAAALLGRDPRGRILSDVVDLSAHDQLGPLLRPALALGMLAMSSPDQYRFSHALLAEALADELDPSEKARLHLRAARAFERHAPNDCSAIAHHLLAAGHLAAEAAVSAALTAAQKCAAQLAFEDAAALLEGALHALALAAPEDRLRRAQLLCERAQALQHAARHALASELCEHAAALVRALLSEVADDSVLAQEYARLFARIALVRGLELRFGHTGPQLIALLSEALGLLDDNPGAAPLRAKLLARLAAAEQPAQDPQQPVERARRAIALAAELDPRDRLDVLYVATAALIDYLPPDELEPIELETLALAQRFDRTIVVHTRLRLCFCALERIDRPAFDAAVQAFAADAAALGLPRWTRQAHMLEALRALLEGRFDAARLAADRYAAISAEMGDPNAEWLITVHRMLAAWTRTVRADDAGRAIAAEYAPARAALQAWIAAQDGDRGATRAALAEAAMRIPHGQDFAAMLGNAIAFAGEREQVQLAYETLLPRSGRIVVTSMVGCCVMDLYDRLLLVLASRLGRSDAIDGHAARALEVAAALGSPVWAARVRADWADALTARARAGDAERAAELWEQAALEAQRLDMPGLAARCAAAVGDVGTPAARAAPRANAAGAASGSIELARSGELWTVRGFGEEVHVKDSRGMQLLARLIAEPGRELHVLDLSQAALRGGDAGPVLDVSARNAYRARLAELVAEREAAERDGDLGRAERASEEIGALSAELERAFGRGGRERKAAAVSERARSNVQRRIAHAIEQIGAGSARLREHLSASVRTGTYCVYAPRG
jgi:AAA ATPase domain